MATNATLKAEKREGTGKGVARKLRQAGRVPAVVYGRDLDALHLSVDAKEAEYLFHSISVDNTIVELSVDGEKGTYETLVREIQTHPWKATLVHIDFLRIQKGVAVEVDIPVHLVGTPKGVKLDGGVLEQTIHDLAVRCIPSMIPESVEVDVSGMEVNDVLHISDIQLPEGVEVMIPGDRTICSVAPPRVDEEPTGELVDGALAGETLDGDDDEDGDSAGDED